MFQVVASDLDGTLLRSDSSVDPFTCSTLREAEALGVKFVLATSRHYLDASYYRDALGIHAHLITLNGARAHDPEGRRIIAHDVEPEVARALMSPETTGRHLLAVFADDGLFVNRPSPELDAYFRRSGFASRVRDMASHDGKGLAKINYMGDKDDLARLEAEILRRFGGRICTMYVLDTCLEIMAPDVAKGPALLEILGRLQVPASACAAFGDGGNDIDLLAVAGQPFIMDRSSPKLVAAFPSARPAGDNDGAGVATTLRQILGLVADTRA